MLQNECSGGDSMMISRMSSARELRTAPMSWRHAIGPAPPNLGSCLIGIVDPLASVNRAMPPLRAPAGVRQRRWLMLRRFPDSLRRGR